MRFLSALILILWIALLFSFITSILIFEMAIEKIPESILKIYFITHILTFIYVVLKLSKTDK